MTKAALLKCIEGTPDERRFLCEQDFGLFFAYYYQEYAHYKFAPFHYQMFGDVRDMMNGTIRDLAWIMFRESGKTSIAQAFVVWLIVFNKKKYINVDSFDSTNAKRFLFDVVFTLQQNVRIIADYGQLYNTKRSSDEVTQKQVADFITNNGIRVEAHSTNEPVRGRKHGSTRPDFLVLDDFETNKTKESKAYTEAVAKHIDEFITGLGPGASILYLCNYITEFGNVQKVIDRSKEDARLRIRMVPIYDEKTLDLAWSDKYVLTDAEVTLGVQYPKVSIEDKKRQYGTSLFAAEMLNKPVDETTQEFKKKYFNTITFEELKKMQTRLFVTVDTALSKKDEADFTGIAMNWVNKENKWHLKAYQRKLNAKEIVYLIFDLHEMYHPEAFYIEEGAWLLAVKPFFDDECRKRNVFPPVRGIKHHGQHKETRIRGLVPRYETNSIYHLEGECVDLEDQLLRFPRAPHDDVSDALAYQIQVAKPPQEETYEEIVEEEPVYPDIGL